MYDLEPLKIVLVGAHSFGCAVYDLLSRRPGVQVVKVFTASDNKLWQHADSSLRSTEKITPASLPHNCDLLISAHSHAYISSAVCAQLRIGAIGYHPSLLPLHRGRDAIQWTIRDRDRITGGSVYWMNDVADGGEIAKQDWCFVDPADTPQTLWRYRLFPMGLRLLNQTISDILQGTEKRMPQNEALATWEPAMHNRVFATDRKTVAV